MLAYSDVKHINTFVVIEHCFSTGCAFNKEIPLKSFLKTCFFKTCMIGVSFCACSIEKQTVSFDKYPIDGKDAYRTKVYFKFV